MTLENISLAQYVSAQLRKAVYAGDLTDYNSTNRTSQFSDFIYPGPPSITELLKDKNNFPRIAIESLPSNTVEEMGMEDPAHLDIGSIKINVWSVRGLICTVKSTTDETIAYADGTSTYALANIPTSEITEVTDGVPTTYTKGIDYQLIDNDHDGFYDSIEWISGGSHPANTADFYVDYARKATEIELVRIIMQDIHAYLRTWRDWSEHAVWGYNVLSNTPIPYETNRGVSRHEMVVQFNGVNIGETI